MAVLSLVSTIFAFLSFPHNSTSTPLLIRELSTSGPYLTTTASYSLLPNQTLYTPSNISAVPSPLPVLFWGNNACSGTGDPYASLNAELASWGNIVIACGSSTSVLTALQAIDEQAGNVGEKWEKVNVQKTGMLGTSCAGPNLYTAANDARVLSLALLDTGSESTVESREAAANASKPVFYFSAGDVDTSSQGLRMEFDAIANGVPSWFGMLPGTDVGLLREGGAGKMGRAVKFWAQWMAAGNKTGSEFFVDATGAESEGWTVVRKGLDALLF